jgi:hypothetical protein
VKNKQFAMYAAAGNHHGDGRPAVWCKATAIDQELLVKANPARYFIPPYVGSMGWVGIRLDRRPHWKTIAELLAEGYRLAAPKRLRGGDHAG